MNWSNNACLGYAILALEELGYTKEQIKKIVNQMNYIFDFVSVNDAADHYCKSDY